MDNNSYDSRSWLTRNSNEANENKNKNYTGEYIQSLNLISLVDTMWPSESSVQNITFVFLKNWFAWLHTRGYSIAWLLALSTVEEEEFDDNNKTEVPIIWKVELVAINNRWHLRKLLSFFYGSRNSKRSVLPSDTDATGKRRRRELLAVKFSCFVKWINCHWVQKWILLIHSYIRLNVLESYFVWNIVICYYRLL